MKTRIENHAAHSQAATKHSLGTSTAAKMVVATLTAAVACVSLAPTLHAVPPDYAAATARLEQAIQYEVRDKQMPAFSIALVDNDRLVWAQGFGWEDAEKKRAASADTIYRAGSVSKLFTDVALLQLVEDGKLDLDAAVTRYLPNFKPRNPYDIEITLRQLMSHQSGLVRESPVGHYFDPTEPTLSETVESLNRTSLVYKPDTKTKYSNAAVSVVGLVLEQLLETPHPEQVRNTILRPLGMDNSGFVVTDAMRPQLATGWMRTYDQRRFEAPKFLLGTGPAGNLYASVNDLAKFLTCLFSNGRHGGQQVISAATLQDMMTPVVNADGKRQRFGLGFHIQELDGHKQVGHGGAVYGFSTQLEALPERKLGVAAASSLDGSNGVVKRLANYALQLMLAVKDQKPLPNYRTTTALPPDRAALLPGAYRDAKGKGFANVTHFGDELYLQHGDFRHRLRMAADNGDILIDDAISFGKRIRFPSQDTISLGDSLMRRSESVPQEIPDRWRGLIGEYGWDYNTLYILEEAGQLFALIEWFYYYPLTEVDDDIFLFPDYGLYHGEGLKFQRDEQGNAVHVVAAEVKFDRREIGTRNGETFKITPVKPIRDLRDTALKATPPDERGEFRNADWVDLKAAVPALHLDIRYASDNNFTGAVFYQQPRAFLQRPAVNALQRAQLRLRPHQLGLLIHDAYRPWHVTKMFWDATPGEFKDFVANPASGSRHNRGCAVDLTLCDLRTGKPVEMVAGYDEFSARSFPLYPGGTSRQRWHRELLRKTMEAEGFEVYEFEWWHFDYQDWKKYRLGNITFEEIDKLISDGSP